MLWSECTIPEVVKLTKQIDALREQYDALPNSEQRSELHARCSALVSERRVIFERRGGV